MNLFRQIDAAKLWHFSPAEALRKLEELAAKGDTEPPRKWPERPGTKQPRLAKPRKYVKRDDAIRKAPPIRERQKTGPKPGRVSSWNLLQSQAAESKTVLPPELELAPRLAFRENWPPVARVHMPEWCVSMNPLWYMSEATDVYFSDGWNYDKNGYW